MEICETGYDEKQKYDIVGSEEVFPLNPDSADLCAIARAKSPKTNQGENMPPGGIIVKNDDDFDVDDDGIIDSKDKALLHQSQISKKSSNICQWILNLVSGGLSPILTKNQLTDKKMSKHCTFTT